MKIRSGFISNSSSSSFVVGFKNRPTSADEIHRLLFGEESGVIEVYGYGLPTRVAAEQVFNDIQGQQPATSDQIFENIRSGYFPGYPEYDYRRDRESDKLRKEFEQKFPDAGYWAEKTDDKEAKAFADRIREVMESEWAEDHRKTDEAALKYWESQKHLFTDCQVYLFEYADDGGQCVLEHGDIFCRLPHLVISRH